jgi:hypothetical protein
MEILPGELEWQRNIPIGGGCIADYLSPDGSVLVDVRYDRKGLRRFREGVFQLARCLHLCPEIGRAYLLIVSPQVSRLRLREEWEIVSHLFSPDIARRFAIAAVDREGTWIEPQDGPLLAVAKLVQSHASGDIEAKSGQIAVRPLARQKHFEVLKVLLNRWMRREGAVPIGRLAEQVGCVYPTAAQALKRLDERQYLIRHSNRSVELRCFPQAAWNELVALSNELRRPVHFVDASGTKPDFPYLLRRMERLRPPHVAWGGVIAARHWHADFDLHGIPRIDLSIHAPQGIADLNFVRMLDPALELGNGDCSAVVAVHLVRRNESLFETASASDLPTADPIETVLDLLEMGLTAQAEQALAHFRPELRLL